MRPIHFNSIHCKKKERVLLHGQDLRNELFTLQIMYFIAKCNFTISSFTISFLLVQISIRSVRIRTRCVLFSNGRISEPTQFERDTVFALINRLFKCLCDFQFNFFVILLERWGFWKIRVGLAHAFSWKSLSVINSVRDLVN